MPKLEEWRSCMNERHSTSLDTCSIACHSFSEESILQRWRMLVPLGQCRGDRIVFQRFGRLHLHLELISSCLMTVSRNATGGVLLGRRGRCRHPLEKEGKKKKRERERQLLDADIVTPNRIALVIGWKLEDTNWGNCRRSLNV